MALPEFDAFYSTVSGYRDYVAYCGVSDDGKKLVALVARLGRRKAMLRKPVGKPVGGNEPDSVWSGARRQRQPTRMTFEPDDNQKLTFAVRGHAVDVVNDREEEEGSE